MVPRTPNNHSETQKYTVRNEEIRIVLCWAPCHPPPFAIQTPNPLLVHTMRNTMLVGGSLLTSAVVRLLPPGTLMHGNDGVFRGLQRPQIPETHRCRWLQGTGAASSSVPTRSLHCLPSCFFLFGVDAMTAPVKRLSIALVLA
jgi:hypothetical protein